MIKLKKKSKKGMTNMKEYFTKGEQLFARLFSKKTANIVRLGILTGAIACVIYATWVVNNVPDWGFEDFCSMPGFWAWNELFLQIGVPYLIIRHIVRFLNPDLDDAVKAYKSEHMSFIYRLLPSMKTWKLFHPLDREYAEYYYMHKRVIGAVNVSMMTDEQIKHIKESDAELIHRLKVESYKAVCRKENRPFSFTEADGAIYREENPTTCAATKKASDQYWNDMMIKAHNNGWDDWKDDPAHKGAFVPGETIEHKHARLIAEGRLKP